MGVDATAQLGAPPHPSFAMVEQEWLEAALGRVAAYLRIEAANDGAELGVLRIVDTGWRSQQYVFLDPHAWLKRVPDEGEAIRLEAADREAYRKWRTAHTHGRRTMFKLSLAFSLTAGVIELSWDVGKYWAWWYPDDVLAGWSHVLKWALLALGVGGLAAYKDYRSIE